MNIFIILIIAGVVALFMFGMSWAIKKDKRDWEARQNFLKECDKTLDEYAKTAREVKDAEKLVNEADKLASHFDKIRFKMQMSQIQRACRIYGFMMGRAFALREKT